MQILTGTAKWATGAPGTIIFTGIDPADAAALATGQEFRFQAAGDEHLYFVVASVVSAVPPVSVTITPNYNGSVPADTDSAYSITRDFTPNRGYPEIGARDVQIRELMTRFARMADLDIQDLYDSGGGGGGGGGLYAEAVLSVTQDAITRTITAANMGEASFPTPPYPTWITPSWPTLCWVVGADKTTGQFVVRFNQPAPSGAEVNVGVGGG
jgi:hypothetical protein